MLVNLKYGSRKMKWLLTGVVVINVLVVTTFHWYLKKHQNAHQSAQLKLRYVNNQITQAENNTQLLLNNLNAYLYHYESGFVGHEQRLNWLESLQALAKEWLIPEVQYQLEVQQEVDIDDVLYETDLKSFDVSSNAQVTLHKTAMAVQMSMLHIGDFFHLYDALAKQKNGRFVYDRCEIKRLSGLGSENVDLEQQNNLNSLCTLSWFSVSPSFDLAEFKAESSRWLNVYADTVGALHD